MERTLILLKPDAVQRGLIGSILERFEAKGLKIVALKLMQISRDLAAKHYAVHKARPFYAGLVDFMTSGPVVALALEGKDAIKVARNLIGATNGAEAAAGTIRGDFGVSRSFNLVHGSDGPDTAAFELGLFFPEGFVPWEQHRLRWLYDPGDELGRA